MNKTYFAKYLSKPGGFQRVVKQGGIPTHTEYEVQLFLCNRDIKVDDKITWHPHSENLPGIIQDEQDIKIVLTSHKELVSHGFKVIGPISPKATWVKEGDEFDEQEVEEWWYNIIYDKFTQHKFHPSDEHTNLWDNPNLTRRFKIKGPFGRFH